MPVRANASSADRHGRNRRLRFDPGARLIASYVRQNTLTIGGDPTSPAVATIRSKAQGGDTSTLKTLTIAASGSNVLGKLDLADTALALDYAGPSPIATIRTQIISGFHEGDWNGNGITSSVAAGDATKALGYAEASEVLGASGGTFVGQNLDGSAVLVRFTLVGDANLDGTVGFVDLVALAQNYGRPITGDSWWSHGDFNYDGIVDFNDLVKLAQNYNTALPAAPLSLPADFATALSQVPEPSTLGILLAACGFAGRPRRSRRRRLYNRFRPIEMCPRCTPGARTSYRS